MEQVTQYVPVLMLFVAAVLFSAGMLILSVVLGQRGRASKIKNMAYECGMLPIGSGSTRLSIKFYLVAMLFILFDIEVVYLYPWAVVFKDLLKDAATRNLVFFSMWSFLGILFAGYIYAVRKGAFDWKS